MRRGAGRLATRREMVGHHRRRSVVRRCLTWRPSGRRRAHPEGRGAMASTVSGSSTRGPTAWTHLADLVTSAGERPTHPVRAPFDGTLIGEVPLCTADDVALAVSRARAAQPAWAGLPIGRRCAIARRFADLVLEREVEILGLDQVEDLHLALEDQVG